MITTNSFLKKIINKKNNSYSKILELKNSNIPTIVYGIGNYSHSITNFLNKNNIKIEAYCIDKKFYNSKDKYYKNKQIHTLDKIDSKYKKYNIIIAFSNYKLGKQKINKLKNYVKAYFFDSVNFYNLIDYKFIKKKLDLFTSTYNLLEDNLSKKIYLAYLNSKVIGSPIKLYKYIDNNQYFPKNVIKLNKNETFIDAGSYIGDTTEKFIQKTKGVYNKIYCFEPNKDSYKTLLKYVSDKKYILTFNKGLYNKKQKVYFQYNSNKSSINKEGDYCIDTITLDEIQTNATFIKMDIEGSELYALYGSKKTIQKLKPKLAICVYHKANDLIKIPQYLKKIVPEYKLYLRHHSFISQELVIYATT